VSSQCEPIKPPFQATEIECITQACDIGNTINFFNGICDIRKCENLNYQLSVVNKGWNVYIYDDTKMATKMATTEANGPPPDWVPGWVPIAVPIICVLVIAGIITVVVLVVKRRAGRHTSNTSVTYENNDVVADTQRGSVVYEEVSDKAPADNGNAPIADKPYSSLHSPSRDPPNTYQEIHPVPNEYDN
jgi:hypothetical protein